MNVLLPQHQNWLQILLFTHSLPIRGMRVDEMCPFWSKKCFHVICSVLSLNTLLIFFFFKFRFKVSCRQQKCKLQVSAKKSVVRDQVESSSFQVCHWRRCKFTWFINLLICSFICSSVWAYFASTSSGLPALQACGMGPKWPGWWQESLSIWPDQLTVW